MLTTIPIKDEQSARPLYIIGSLEELIELIVLLHAVNEQRRKPSNRITLTPLEEMIERQMNEEIKDLRTLREQVGNYGENWP
jgi:hypothetical protein